MAHDIELAANEELSEQLSGEKDTAENLISTVEDADHNFDFDSFAPYTSEEDEILSEYESEYYSEAQGLLSGEKEYSAEDWASAKRAYVAAIAYCAFSSIFGTAKQELTEALEEFNSDAESLMSGLVPEISISRTCPHGWASHNREDSDGTMYWESGQLDGCNGVARKVGELWLSVCWNPKDIEHEEEEPTEQPEQEQLSNSIEQEAQ